MVQVCCYQGFSSKYVSWLDEEEVVPMVPISYKNVDTVAGSKLNLSRRRETEVNLSWNVCWRRWWRYSYQRCTLSKLKYFNTTKLTCTNYVIYWLSAKLGSKKEIEIYKYIKYDVSALTWVKISNFLVFREVLIY